MSSFAGEAKGQTVLLSSPSEIGGRRAQCQILPLVHDDDTFSINDDNAMTSTK